MFPNACTFENELAELAKPAKIVSSALAKIPALIKDNKVLKKKITKECKDGKYLISSVRRKCLELSDKYTESCKRLDLKYKKYFKKHKTSAHFNEVVHVWGNYTVDLFASTLEFISKSKTAMESIEKELSDLLENPTEKKEVDIEGIFEKWTEVAMTLEEQDEAAQTLLDNSEYPREALMVTQIKHKVYYIGPVFGKWKEHYEKWKK